MATERVQVPIEKAKLEILTELARRENVPLSQLASKLISTALELAEDMALAHVAERRLSSFSRDDSFSSGDLLKWNKARTKKK